MQYNPTAAVEPESNDEGDEAEHPGADTLNMPSFDEAGFLRWSHDEPADEESPEATAS